ncbi:hypothetical protein H2248_001330 [Termitomyces sp. 'cryptogamus']|nr:hypothetical protein H2248_001330 [Termitomyces sp. 'cryptogamus']
MCHTHVIDNEEPQLFHFDSCDVSDLLDISTLNPVPARANLTTLEPTSHFSSHSTTLTSETLTLGDAEVTGKGKGVARTFPISDPVISDLFEIHSASMPSTSYGSTHSSNLSIPLTPSYFDHYTFYNDAQQQQDSPIHKEIESANMGSESQSKGKERESPPVLPPLAFSPTEFYAPSTSSLLGSPSSGPSSYTSNILPLTRFTSNTESLELSFSPPGTENKIPSFHPNVHRSRSLSSISNKSSRPLTARSLSQLKSRLTSSRSSNNFARRLLFKKPVDLEVLRLNNPSVQSFNGSEVFDGGSSLRHTGLKVDELDVTFTGLSDLQLQDTTSKSSNIIFNHTVLKHKGRSNSSPFPISALDIVPSSTSDVFTSIPLVVKNYFDEILPRELRLCIFEALVTLHEADHLCAVRQARWCVAKASSSRNRWVGRDGGVRELVKLSRVSKSWQMLAFDGQLWANLDLHSFPNMVESLILRFTANAGQSIRTIDISGNTKISAVTLLDISDHLCVSSNIESLCYTQLTAINLQGCSALTTRSLHHLLLRSPCLQKLCVKGLKAVTNATCSILSTYSSQLVSLDVGRCINMDAEGIESMATAALNRGDHLSLKELRMSGFRGLNNDMMATLGRAAPYLEVLDLSHARQLHNSAVDAFVACGMEQDTSSGTKTVLVPPRDLGRLNSDEIRIRRRVTRLRHLSLSHCILLTDDACSNLAYSVPDLEFLELGGIGSDLKDDGLIRLLSSTPYIRRIDLEDASHITDAVLTAITPPSSAAQPRPADAAPEPGHALEQLNISFAVNLTNEALLSLVRGCTRLQHLEADNTHISSTVIKEFVRLCHQRGIVNAKANVVDCRGVTENIVKDLAGMTRPRMGWRAYEARKLMFLDMRDGNADELKVGQDECDEKRVVLKSFYSWQTVDNVKAVREKRRRSKRRVGGDSKSDDGLGRSLRWWSPGGRGTPRTAGTSSPLNIADMNSDGCRVM